MIRMEPGKCHGCGCVIAARLKFCTACRIESRHRMEHETYLRRVVSGYYKQGESTCRICGVVVAGRNRSTCDPHRHHGLAVKQHYCKRCRIAVVGRAFLCDECRVIQRKETGRSWAHRNGKVRNGRSWKIAYCKQCGKPFRADTGPDKEFCCTRCWYDWRTKNSVTTTPCKVCGKPVTASRSRRAKKNGRCGNYCSVKCYQSTRVNMRNIACAGCGQITTNGSGLCGQCYAAYWRAVNVLRGMAKLLKETLKIEYKTCQECGKELDISHIGRHKRYCSKACNWRALRRKRRARLRHAHDEVVELNVVAERDRWVCQLCGKHVRKDARYKRQATIDHIIPLSRGGRHSYANCQLAHFDCNSSKNNSMHDAQPRLFG